MQGAADGLKDEGQTVSQYQECNFILEDMERQRTTCVCHERNNFLYFFEDVVHDRVTCAGHTCPTVSLYRIAIIVWGDSGQRRRINVFFFGPHKKGIPRCRLALHSSELPFPTKGVCLFDNGYVSQPRPDYKRIFSMTHSRKRETRGFRRYSSYPNIEWKSVEEEDFLGIILGDKGLRRSAHEVAITILIRVDVISETALHFSRLCSTSLKFMGYQSKRSYLEGDLLKMQLGKFVLR